jgi:phosphatidate cytidylyltransferase
MSQTRPDFSSHLTRLATGVCLAALIALMLYYRGLPLLFFVLGVTAVSLWEFYSLFWDNRDRVLTRICAIILGWGMLCLTWMRRPQDALVFLGAGFLIAALSFLFRWDLGDEQEAFAPGGLFLTGLAYIPLLLLPTTYLSSPKLLLVLCCVAVSDIGAYYIGTRYGQHRLWPRVSPHKSVEGALGSMAACVVVCTVLGVALGKAPWWVFLLLGILINIFAQLGDLFESALKRSCDRKDSGVLLPGHGGMLDRIDSLLFALPVFAVVDQWFPFFK